MGKWLLLPEIVNSDRSSKKKYFLFQGKCFDKFQKIELLFF